MGISVETWVTTILINIILDSGLCSNKSARSNEMHITCRFVFPSLLFLSLFVQSAASSVRPDSHKWASIGPYMGSILCLAIDPSNQKTVYVGTFGAGIFKSTDGGSTWNAANDGVILINANGVRMSGPMMIGSLAIDRTNPSTIFAGTYDGVLKSTNAGASWALSTRDRQIDALIIAPSNSNIVYAGRYGGSHDDYVLKTTDAGTSWTKLKHDLIKDEIHALAVDPFNPNILYAGTRTGGFRTSDGGTSWAPAGTGLPATLISAIAIDPQNSNSVYAATYSGIFKSSDGGMNWNAINQGLHDRRAFAITIDQSNTRTIFAGLYDGISMSTDSGASWSVINTGLPNVPVRAIGLHPPSNMKPAMKASAQLLYAATTKGVFVSTDGGERWAGCSAGINNSRIMDLAVDPSNTNTVCAATSYGVWKSTNAGANWAASNNGLESVLASKLAMAPSTPGTIYAGSTWGTIHKTTDGGARWTEVYKRLPDASVTSLAVDPSNPNIVYAGINNRGLLRSTNGGESWTEMINGIPIGSGGRIAIDPFSTNLLYAAIKKKLFKSTNGGESWAEVFIHRSQPEITMIAMARSGTLYVGSSMRTFKSTNGGADWVPGGYGISANSSSITVDPSNSNLVYVAGIEGGIYVSTNGGDTWARDDDGLFGIDNPVIAIDPSGSGIVYAGTGAHSVFKRQFKPGEKPK